MALIGCAECGNQVSDKAAACPKCGAPVVAAPLTTSSPTPGVAQQSTPASVVLPSAQPISPQARAKPFFTVGRVLAWLFILSGSFVLFKIATGASLLGAIAGPRTLVNERIELNEGGAQSYGFELRQRVRVEVTVAAAPKNVNVMLMSEHQWQRFREVQGSLWGGQYDYTTALSRRGVLDWRGSEILPPGKWRVVVERPHEAMLFGDSTNAQVTVIIH